MSVKRNMDSLNCYCIGEICKWLDLQGQINMAIISPDFLHELQALWQKSYKVLQLHEIVKRTNSDIFIQSIKGTVKKLILCGFRWENKDSLNEILSKVKFPNVDTVQMGFSNTWWKEHFDDLVLLIVKSCRNVTELHLNKNFTGKYIGRLEKLERISLKCSPLVFECEYTANMFEKRKLKKVCLFKDFDCENVVIYVIAASDLIHNLVKCKTIEELYFDSDFLEQKYLDQIIANLKKLRKVSFAGYADPYQYEELYDEELSDEPFYELQLDNLKGNICGLVRGIIVYGYWIELDSKQEAFLNLMSRLNNLELLSFSNARINLQFLRRLIQRLNEHPQVHIYCHNTQVTDDDVRLLSNFSNVNISLAAYKYDRFERSNIDILLNI